MGYGLLNSAFLSWEILLRGRRVVVIATDELRGTAHGYVFAVVFRHLHGKVRKRTINHGECELLESRPWHLNLRF